MLAIKSYPCERCGNKKSETNREEVKYTNREMNERNMKDE